MRSLDVGPEGTIDRERGGKHKRVLGHAQPSGGPQWGRHND
jgi:hypothetical protein